MWRQVDGWKRRIFGELKNERGRVRGRFQRRLVIGSLGVSQENKLEPRIVGGQFFC